jgi:hypothetical protein
VRVDLVNGGAIENPRTSGSTTAHTVATGERLVTACRQSEFRSTMRSCNERQQEMTSRTAAEDHKIALAWIGEASGERCFMSVKAAEEGHSEVSQHARPAPQPSRINRATAVTAAQVAKLRKTTDPTSDQVIIPKMR